MRLEEMQWVTIKLSRISWDKDPIEQLEASKSSIANLFSDILNKTKGFKYQTILKVTLKNTSQKKLNLVQFILIQTTRTICDKW